MNQYTKYLDLKSVIESLFGSEAWYELKEANHLPTWKKQLTKVIGAIHISILASVESYDEDWLQQINEAVLFGKKKIKSAKDIEEAISSLAAAFINISFLQAGLMPRRNIFNGVITLKKENWRLNNFRTVIYIQNTKQKEAEFWSKQQRDIGFQRQIELWNEFRHSERKIPYSVWCKEKEA